MRRVWTVALVLLLVHWNQVGCSETQPAAQMTAIQPENDVIVYQDDTIGKWHYRRYLQPASSRSRWTVGDLSFDGTPVTVEGNGSFMWTPWGKLTHYERGAWKRGWLPHNIETPAPKGEEVPSPDRDTSGLIRQRYEALTMAAESLRIRVAYSEKNGGGHLVVVVGDEHVELPDSVKNAQVKNWRAAVPKQAMVTIIDRCASEGFLAKAFDPRLARVAAEAPALAISFSDSKTLWLEVRPEPRNQSVEQLRRVFAHAGDEQAQKEVAAALDAVDEFVKRRTAQTQPTTQPANAGMLRGRAVHKGQPVAGVQINIFPRGKQQPLGTTHTDAEGRFEVKGLPANVELEVVAIKLQDDSWLLNGSGRTTLGSDDVSEMEDISLGAMPPPVSTPDTPPIKPTTQPVR